MQKRKECSRVTSKSISNNLSLVLKFRRNTFQRKFRNYRLEFSDGNMYRKIGRHEKCKYVS